MKRRYLMSAVLMVLLAGCGGPAVGVDGDLVDDWAMLPAAKVPVPVAGTCYRKGVKVRTIDMRSAVTYGEVVGCTEPHVSETFYVQAVTAAFTDASATFLKGSTRTFGAVCGSVVSVVPRPRG